MAPRPRPLCPGRASLVPSHFTHCFLALAKHSLCISQVCSENFFSQMTHRAFGSIWAFRSAPFDGEANCDTLLFFHGRTHWHITSRFSTAPPQSTRFNHRDDDAILNSGSLQLFQHLSRRVETIPTCESRRNDWPWLGSKKS